MNDESYFNKGCLIKLEVSCWSGRAKIPSAQLLNGGNHDDVDPAFVGAHKRLVDGDALKAVEQLRNEARSWLYSQSLPFPIEGACFVPTSLISKIDDQLVAYERRFEALADAFAADYAAIREGARAKLGSLYSESDYPKDVRRRFGFSWSFITLAPAGNMQLLSPELVKREERKFQQLMQQAQADAVGALRTRFAELVDHVVDRLTGDREGGKPKVFRDSLVTNIKDFLGVFQHLNVADDGALKALVERVESFTSGVDAGALREDGALRAHVATKMAEVQTSLDSMMVDRPTRRLRLGAAPAALAAD